MLVAGASLSLIAPIAAQASDMVNLEEMNSYSSSKSQSSIFDSKTFINEVSEDIANLKGRVDGLEAQQNELEAGTIPDQPAPEIAINYWNLPLHATLKDVVRVIRDDEAGHRDVNHTFADLINIKKNKEIINKSNKEKKESGEEILD